MTTKTYFKQGGFTLLELMISLGILSLVIGMTMSSWLSFMQKSNRVNAQAGLDMESRSIIENFRAEMSKTSRESIIFYPENSAPYQAVAFALPADQDGDGLMDMNPATSNILWRQTVVYHIFNQPSPKPPQMRRTQFNNRYGAATYLERYGQVQAVVASGSGTSACLGSETASTRVMFENLFTGRLWHAEARFDGYAPTPNTKELVNFGVTPVGPGPQLITFTIVDKNPLSSGRKFGIDRLTASASGWFMESELLPNTATIPKTYAGMGVASAGYGLLAATTANGQEVNLTLNNDAIEECLFIGGHRNVVLSNTVVRFDTEYKPTGFDNGVICTKLAGDWTNAWRATEQAQRSEQPYVYWYMPTNQYTIVRIPILSDPTLNADGEPSSYGIKKSGFNPVVRVFKSLYNGGINLIAASFVIIPKAELPTKVVDGIEVVDNAAIGPIIGDTPEIIPLDIWQNGAVTTWKNAIPNSTQPNPAPGTIELHNSTKRNIVVPMGSTLMLQLAIEVPSGTSSDNRAIVKPMNRPDLPGCWFKRATTSLEKDLALQSLNWGTDCISTNCIPFLRTLVVNYPDEGSYVSHPFDTTDTSGTQKKMLWEQLMPAAGGGAFDIFARTGNSISEDGYEIEDASDWSSLSPLTSTPPADGVAIGTGRYVQFRTTFESQRSARSPDDGPPIHSPSATYKGPYRNDTPHLRWVRITYPGQNKYVDVAGELLKGPDRGIFTVKVNGKELVRGVTMEIEIFKDIRGVGGVPLRITSAVSAEVDPRNSGK